MNTVDWFVLITSKDLSTIHKGISALVQPFTSPFMGQSIDEVAAWFDANITQPDIVGYMKRMFIVLEAEAVDDEICTVVCTQDDEVEKLRCDFTLALQNVLVLDVGQPMEERIMGSYKRSGMFMTKENLKLAGSGGMYLDGMEG